MTLDIAWICLARGLCFIKAITTETNVQNPPHPAAWEVQPDTTRGRGELQQLGLALALPGADRAEAAGGLRGLLPGRRGPGCGGGGGGQLPEGGWGGGEVWGKWRGRSEGWEVRFFFG